MFRLLRGVLLVVIGIVIGVVVLANTLEEADDEPETVAGGETATTTTQAAAPSTIPQQPTVTAAPTNTPASAPAAPTTIPPPEVVSPELVRVQVFNGTDTQGAAGRLTTTLAAANYVTLPPQNAPEEGQYATSSIYFTTPDYLGNAGHVASLLGVTNPGVIQQLPNPSPITHDRAHVIVVIGGDGLAS